MKHSFILFNLIFLDKIPIKKKQVSYTIYFPSDKRGRILKFVSFIFSESPIESRIGEDFKAYSFQLHI